MVMINSRFCITILIIEIIILDTILAIIVTNIEDSISGVVAMALIKDIEGIGACELGHGGNGVALGSVSVAAEGIGVSVGSSAIEEHTTTLCVCTHLR